MVLDLGHAFFMLMATCLLVAVMLLIAWDHNRRLTAYLWWTAGFLAGAVGLGLIAVQSILHEEIAGGVGTVVLLLGLGLCWAGARSFDDRPIHAWPVALSMLIWTIIYTIPAIQASETARSALTSTMVGIYSLAIAREFWTGRGDALSSRVPLAALCALNGVVHLGRLAVVLMLPVTGTIAGGEIWLGMLLFQPALIMVAGGLFGVSIGRDRVERELRRSATVDSLTQVLNRGALIDRAEALLKQAQADGRPLSLLLFDLDRFKLINDSLGHQAGDLVLQAFADVARQCLRGNDVLGRIGGEEFVAVLPGVGAPAAQTAAERVRREFSRRRIDFNGVIIPATVSVGVVALAGSDTGLDDLLSLADRALYDAKRGGRDQVRNALPASA